MIIVIENKSEENILCYRPGAFLQAAVEQIALVLGTLRARLHFFQLKKKKGSFVVFTGVKYHRRESNLPAHLHFLFS